MAFRMCRAAIVLSMVGGGIGIALGLGLSRGVTAWMSWPTKVSPEAVAIAFVFAAATGVFFGFYPAAKPPRSTRSMRKGSNKRV